MRTASLARRLLPLPALRRSSSLSAVHRVQDLASKGGDAMREFPPERIRNFSIIAHIDHGKSSLSDRLLELCGNVEQVERAQVLDSLQVERERGITVKAQTTSMVWRPSPEADPYLLNLIDTPGHVDFSYEVSRSLAACDGALLLVDASQGVQAQTLATYALAKAQGLAIVPVLTKVDLPHAMPEDAALSMAAAFDDVDPDAVLLTSAKTGAGVAEVLPALVGGIPPPRAASGRAAPGDGAGAGDGASLRALLIDSWFDEHRGVVCLVQVRDGVLAEGSRICAHSSLGGAAGGAGGAQAPAFSVQEVGLLTPGALRVGALHEGQVGYVVANMRSTSSAHAGDTLVAVPAPGRAAPAALGGFRRPSPTIFASMLPLDSSGFEELDSAVSRLLLNDASVTVQREELGALGTGLRCGFLGLLHMEVFHQRLRDEFAQPVLMTAPSVPYVVAEGGARRTLRNLADWPAGDGPREVLEPMVEASIIAPASCLGALLEELIRRRGEERDLRYLDEDSVMLRYLLPWAEVCTDFHDALKNLSAGYASFSYAEAEPRPADLVKVELAINQDVVEPLSFVCHRDRAESEGRRIAKVLRGAIDRQQFVVNIQAKVAGTKRVIASERLQAYRKDVLTKSGKTVGGGDVTRKKKLLEAQKRGKKLAKTVGKVKLSQEALWSVLAR